jgi:hypothetical protein
VIRRHFEREPTDGDPLFPERYLYTDTDHERMMLKAMRDAGIDDDKIYAYKKTGRLIAESHIANASGAALQEWSDAIAEFHSHGGDPLRESEGAIFDALLSSIREEFTPLIFLFGFAADKYFNTDLIDDESPGSALSPLQFVGLCAAKTHRTLRAIKHLLEEGMSDDALSLARTVYENYLHATYVLNNPQGLVHLVDVALGIKNGTHAYEIVKGKIDKRVVIELATQAKFPGHISAYKMAAASSIPSDLAFFDVFYSRSSEILHPTVLRLESYLSEKGLDAMTAQLDEEAILYSALIATMMLQLVRDLPRVPEILHADIETIISRVRARIIEAVQTLDTWQKRANVESPEIKAISDRCSDLASGKTR